MTPKAINDLVRLALKEDAAGHDITTLNTVSAKATCRAAIVAGEKAIVCGTQLAAAAFRQLDSRTRVRIHTADGKPVVRGQTVLEISAKIRAVLSAERTALNLLGYASGISTLTRSYTRAAGRKDVAILDTRKTLPGLRDLARLAVRTGGGVNHRLNLAEMVMIKDNHRAVLGRRTLAEVIHQIRKSSRKKIIIEVDNLNQFKEALAAKPDIILLDNMTPARLRQAVQLKHRLKSRAALEASGGINLKTVRRTAQTGVDRISIGALTHSAPGINFSLEIIS